MAFPGPACPHTGSAPLLSKLPSTTCTWEELRGPGGQGQALPGHRKFTSTTVHTSSLAHTQNVILYLKVSLLGLPELRKCCTPTEKATQHHALSGRAKWHRSARTSPAWPWEVCFHHCVLLPVPPTLGSAPLTQRKPASSAHPQEELHSEKASHPAP